MRKNIIIDTDAYKLTHFKQYPQDLTRLYSYGESRVGSKYPFVSFFGLDMIIEDHFLQPVTNEMINEAEEEAFMTFGTAKYFNRPVWERVRDLGYLPIRIKAVPEGTKVGISNTLFTLDSTVDWFAKTLNSLESTTMHVWYPTTIATRAMYIKENITPAFMKSSDIPEILIPIAVNDFGYRGATGHEAASRGGAAFLTHFIGGDNMPASRAIKDYYGYKGRTKSVWATEHSVATSFGLKFENEMDYLRHQLVNADVDAIISVVIDSKDPNNFIKYIAGSEEMVSRIKARSGRVVFRPDSGIPFNNMYDYTEMLAYNFGEVINNKGYKVIGNNVGLLQGDGMDEVSIPKLYNDYVATGWAADNFLTGSGGGLLQVDANRDTQRFAIKAALGEKNGVPFDIRKQPKSDMSKASKGGELKLVSPTKTVSSTDNPTEFNNSKDIMRTVLENGVHTKMRFEDILANTLK